MPSSEIIKEKPPSELKLWFRPLYRIASFFILINVLVLPMLSGQELQQNYNRNAYRYERYLAYGLTFQTNDDLGIEFRYARIREADKVQIFQFNAHSLQHPQEIRYINPSIPGSSPYKFGKLNFALVNTFTYGGQKIIAEKNDLNQVKVNWNYMGGLNLTFLKPIYLQIYQSSGDSQQRYTVERYDPDIHNQQQENFYGTAPFTKGLDELSTAFGLAGRSGISFYWGQYDDHYYGLEAGGELLAYPDKLEILANDNNRQLFINLFLSLKLIFQS